MSEIDDLLELYGAIDRAVTEDDSLALVLAPILGPYRGGRAKGWYANGYLPWREEIRERAERREAAARSRAASKAKPRRIEVSGGDVPQATDATAHAAPPPRAGGPQTLAGHALDAAEAMSRLAALPVGDRASARRMLAIAAAMRVFPELSPAGTHPHHARRALVFNPEFTGQSIEMAEHRAVQLQELLHNELRQLDDWSAVVHKACDMGWAPPELRSQAEAKPCTGHLVSVPDPDDPTDADLCTVIAASFEAPDVTFEQALAYLQPENWPDASDLWCVMKRGAAAGPDSWIYDETVSTDCDDQVPTWKVSTQLQFWFSYPDSNHARIEYDLAPGQPDEFADILVDEGSLELVRLAHGIRLDTTKRVRFAGSMDGAWLAMWMCASGYGGVLEDVVFNAAENSAKPTSVKFPIDKPKKQVPPMTPPKKSGSKKAASGGAAGDPTYGSTEEESLDDVIDEAVGMAKGYLEDMSNTYQASYKKVKEGKYKVEEAWADGISMWSTYVSGMAKAMDIGVRASKAFSKPAAGTEDPQE